MWFPTTLTTIALAAFLLLSTTNASGREKVIPTYQGENLGVNEYQLYAAIPEVLENFTENIKTGDARGEIVRKFLEMHNSPLVPYSQLLVKTADTYNLDFRLLPAIAMQESNLCKKMPEESYNCWGFGIYGDKVTRFSSFEEAIETVAKTIRSKYVDKGHLTIEEIQAKYTPASRGSWARSVEHFMNQMR